MRRILAERLVIRAADDPTLRGAIHHLADRDEIIPVLPGVYSATELATDFAIRVLAVASWDPDAILTETAAAKLTYWRDIAVPRFVARSARRSPRSRLRSSRRIISPELVVDRGLVRCTTPALTAVDLGADAIDAALRARVVTVADLRVALDATHGRRGHQQRRLIVHDSRDNPWSAAERLAHQLLRDGCLTDWKANHLLRLPSRTVFVDIAFPRERLGIEIDGYAVHSTPATFQADRARGNDLLLAGWRILHFTWADLTQNPAVVLLTIQRALGR